MSRLARLALALTVLAPALSLTGCNSFGSHAVRTARFPYNEALARTSNEQLLLNLVRLRYRDTPYFLQETSLTTQYELSGGASAGVTLIKGGDNEGSTGVGVSISETPTVAYVPLQGEDFVKQLMSRIRLEDVMLLPESGWSIERVLRLAVDRLAGIPNAPSTTGPTPGYRPFFEDFNNLACRLRRLQVQGRLELEAVRFERPGGDPAKSGEETDGNKTKGGGEKAEDQVLYFFELIEHPRYGRSAAELSIDCGTAEAAWSKEPDDRAAVLAAFAVPLEGAEAEEEAQAREGRSKSHALRLLLDGDEPGLEAGHGVPLLTRSLLGILYYLSQGVEVPRGDLERHLAVDTSGTTEGRNGAGDDWADALYADFFRVRVAEERPAQSDTFLAVPYRGHWFYIPDDDLETKSTWGLLAQLVSLQAGGEARGLVPALTLSAGR